MDIYTYAFANRFYFFSNATIKAAASSSNDQREWCRLRMTHECREGHKNMNDGHKSRKEQRMWKGKCKVEEWGRERRLRES